MVTHNLRPSSPHPLTLVYSPARPASPGASREKDRRISRGVTGIDSRCKRLGLLWKRAAPVPGTSSMAAVRGAAGLLAAMLLLALLCCPQQSSAQLANNFYAKKCSKVESIVFSSIQSSFKSNNGIAPGITRMHFHDAFVGGADGSVLPTSTSTNTAERDAPPNRSLRGFEAVFAAKAAVEKACPGIVSCADILTLAARDSVVLSGGPFYSVRTGRRDAFGSLASNVNGNLPGPQSNVDTLNSIFNSKGLTQDDMVVLSGAHTFGIANCPAFTARLYPTVDPTLNATRAASLKTVCPATNTAASVSMDILTANKFDNAYYRALRTANGLFNSDQNLFIDSRTNPLATSLGSNQADFFKRFIVSVRKMGEIGVLTGTQGQIKTDCSIA